MLALYTANTAVRATLVVVAMKRGWKRHTTTVAGYLEDGGDMALYWQRCKTAPFPLTGKAYTVPTRREFRINKNGLAEAKPLLLLVGRARFELATNGLKVRCSTG